MYIAVIIFLVSICIAQETLTVQTQYGPVRGKLSSDQKVWIFRGIPYAAAPVGGLRLADPVKPTSWTTIRDAFEYGPSCVQWDTNTGEVFGQEDCVYFNMYLPANFEDLHKLPNIIYVHGGGQNLGSGGSSGTQALASNYYNGEYFVSTQEDQAIVWAFNYPLNAFGFVALEEIRMIEGKTGGTATRFQFMFYEHVKNETSRYNGDPNKMGLTGVSGGANAILTAAASPLTEHLGISLFHAGSNFLSHASTLEQQERAYGYLLDTRGNCTGYSNKIDCVRGMNTSEYVRVFVEPSIAPFIGVKNFPYNDPLGEGIAAPTPPIGGDILPLGFIEAFSQTNVNKQASFVFGSVDKEWSLYLLAGVPMTRDLCAYSGFRQAMHVTNKSAAEVYSMVNGCLDQYLDNPVSWLDCFSGVDYSCSSRQLLIAAASNRNRKVYQYIYAYKGFPFLPFAGHGDDLILFQGPLDYYVFIPFPAVVDDYTRYLSNFMQQMLITFTSGKEVRGMPRYGIYSKKYTLFNNTGVFFDASNYYPECDCWNSIKADSVTSKRSYENDFDFEELKKSRDTEQYEIPYIVG